MTNVPDNNKPKLKLNEDELKNLVEYFDLLIQMDQEQKYKPKQDDD